MAALLEAPLGSPLAGAGAAQEFPLLQPPRSPALQPSSVPASPALSCAPNKAAEGGVSDLLELVTTLRIFISCVERYPHDSVAGAVAGRALAPLAQATELCVRGVLEEYKDAASRGNLVALLSAVWFIREFCEASISARGLVRQHGGPSLLGPALSNPEADDHLLRESVRLLDCLQGPVGLLQTIPEVLEKGPRVLTALLWRIRESSREPWHGFGSLPPKAVLQAAISSFEAHPDNRNVHDAALALLADLLQSVEYRTAFADVGGWPYVLLMMEARGADLDVQRRGLQILCELQRGGACVGEHMARVARVVMSALETFHEDSHILEWGLWLLLELGGLPEVLGILKRAGDLSPGELSPVGLSTLKALQQVQWGQTDRADPSTIPEFVSVVGACAMRALQASSQEALELGVRLLLDAAHAAAGVPEGHLPASASQARTQAVDLVLEVLRRRVLDVSIVVHCLEVVRVFQVAEEGSSTQHQIREGLGSLLQRLGDAHASQDVVQKTVLLAHGVIMGPAAVVSFMERLDGSLPCWLAGIKTLGHIYDDLEELDTGARAARGLAARAVVAGMHAWPKELHLLTHSCFTLSAMAAHGVDGEGGPYTDRLLQQGLQAAWSLAAPPADEQEVGASFGWRSRQRFLRHEILRLEVESLKVAPEQLALSLRPETLRVGVATAQCKALLRDAQTGDVDAKGLADHLQMALVALGLCGRADDTVEVLRQGASLWPPLVRGAADAAVELSRLGAQAALVRAGLADAARAARERCQPRAGQLDAEAAYALEALHLAEGLVAQAGA